MTTPNVVDPVATSVAHLGIDLPTMPRPPMVVPATADLIPKSLAELDQWVNWRFELREDKWTKVPLQPNGRAAKSNDPSTWATFEKVFTAAAGNPELGIGFVFAEEGGLVGVDLDDCLDDQGHLKPWARPIIECFVDTYMETSPSGMGVKVFCRGNLDGLVANTGMRRKYHDGAVEVYQHARFFTLTGRVFSGAPLEVEEHQADIQWLLAQIGVRGAAKNNESARQAPSARSNCSGEEMQHLRDQLEAAKENDPKFKALFQGGACGFTSLNEGDLSFCDYLARNLLLDAGRIDAAFRLSKRMRPKWDERHFADGRTYGQATIQKALLPLPDAGEAPESSTQPGSQLRFFPYTDSGNAERIVVRYGHDIRHCHPQKTWYVWDGRRWAPDRQGRLMHIAKRIARSLYEEASQIVDDAKREACAAFARKCESTDRKRAALVSTQSEPGIPALPEDFDTDPFLFNCFNGTINLRATELAGHRREDMITKLAPVQYSATARSALWERFLDESTCGNRELQEFLQRAVGYSLTGSVSEEKLFFVHGPGGSGKSTFLETIKTVLGDYAKTADFESFVARSQSGGVRDDIAELAGRRFVVSIEVDEGKKLAEGLTKLLTGGDTVRARFLYQQGFEFLPQFKLWLAANHAPRVKHDDSAMWRRILRIPFEHVVAKEKRDPSVKARLKDVRESGPAILAWAVEGCLRWREEGLGIPAVVEEATEQYRLDMDPLHDFFADCCVFSKTAWGTAKALRKAYEVYCRDHGEKHPLAPKEFAGDLRARGCESDHRRAGNVWLGIGLLSEDPGGGIM